MTIYTPFLKLKQNELQAIASLATDIASTIRPLLDIPRPSKTPTEADILDRLRLGDKELGKMITTHDDMEFFLDNYDLDDTVLLNGRPQYEAILDTFSAHNPIPVLALNRVTNHNASAIAFASARSKSVGLRLHIGDIESFALAEKSLDDLWAAMKWKIESVHLLLDFRYLDSDVDVLPITIAFINKFNAKYATSSITSTGSIIPANISELIKTNNSLEVERREITLWEALRAEPGLSQLIFGDYCVVSPDYSDAELDPRLLRQVSTPKVFYPFAKSMFVSRGSSFESHPKGNGQYFDLADSIVTRPYYRKEPYSAGDRYIYVRSSLSPSRPAKAGTQGSWTKAMTNAHITYVSRALRGLP